MARSGLESFSWTCKGSHPGSSPVVSACNLLKISDPEDSRGWHVMAIPSRYHYSFRQQVSIVSMFLCVTVNVIPGLPNPVGVVTNKRVVQCNIFMYDIHIYIYFNYQSTTNSITSWKCLVSHQGKMLQRRL